LVIFFSAIAIVLIDKTGMTFFSFGSLRMLLQKSCVQSSGAVQRLQSSDSEESETTTNFVRKIITDSLQNLEGESPRETRPIRWELGACWVQHLQSQTSEKTDTKKSDETKDVPTVKGLGKQFGQLKEIKKKSDDNSGKSASTKESTSPNASDAHNTGSTQEGKEAILQKALSEAAFQRLRESETGLHAKVIPHHVCIGDFINAFRRRELIILDPTFSNSITPSRCPNRNLD
jgi:protein TIF31